MEFSERKNCGPSLTIKDAELYIDALQTLDGDRHLLDELVYFYIRMLYENLIGSSTKVKLVSPDFYSKLQIDNKNRDRAKMIRTYQKLILQEATLILFPVCTREYNYSHERII